MNRSSCVVLPPAARAVAAGFSPLDERLGLLSGSRLTPRLIEGIVRLGTHLPFAQVPPLIQHFTGVVVDAETVRRLTEAAGAVQVARETAAVEQIERRLPRPPVGPARQVVSVDGVMVPLVGGSWAEVRTLAIGVLPAATAERTSEVRTTELSYFARLADAATFTRLATVETHRRGTEQAQTVVGVVDGAEWCQGFLDHQRSDAVRILDFAHALEHLGQVAQALFGAGTEAASAWLGAQAHALHSGQEDAVLATLLDLAATTSPAAARTVVEQTYRYLAARQNQIRYAAFLQAGYPIGSGCIESANKLLVEARLKGRGMHWSREAVNPMLALRTLVGSGRWATEWDALWAAWRCQHQTRVRRRQSRHHHRRLPRPTRDPTAQSSSSTASRHATIRGGAPHPSARNHEAHPSSMTEGVQDRGSWGNSHSRCGGPMRRRWQDVLALILRPCFVNAWRLERGYDGRARATH
jgi:hypothetical protein